MPWKVSSPMSQRLEFIRLASQEAANIRDLCRRFGISSATAYKWLSRYQEATAASTDQDSSHPLHLALCDRSRRPLHSPHQTPDEVEQLVIQVRTAHPSWGGRKIRARLIALGHVQQQLPQPSTITSILSRHQLIDEEESNKRHQLCRFEHPHPNELWQMDFKGEFPIDCSSTSGFCYPLTVLDDHSRFALALTACPSQSIESTQKALTEVFRRYGLPQRMTMDNGSPWGNPRGPRCYTHFGVWLMRLGIGVTHSRPHHPQTQGKDERFHRTLEAELLASHRRDQLSQSRKNNRGRRPFPRLFPDNSIAAWQQEFDLWRVVYNCQRPHEALGMQVPAQRYQPSPRSFPEVLPAIEYDSSEIVRKVPSHGYIRFERQRHFIGHAFEGQSVALRYTVEDGVMDVIFGEQKVGEIRLR